MEYSHSSLIYCIGVEVDGVLPQFSETSFKYITLENPIRKICIKILLNPWVFFYGVSFLFFFTIFSPFVSCDVTGSAFKEWYPTCPILKGIFKNRKLFQGKKTIFVNLTSHSLVWDLIWNIDIEILLNPGSEYFHILIFSY